MQHCSTSCQNRSSNCSGISRQGIRIQIDCGVQAEDPSKTGACRPNALFFLVRLSGALNSVPYFPKGVSCPKKASAAFVCKGFPVRGIVCECQLRKALEQANYHGRQCFYGPRCGAVYQRYGFAYSKIQVCKIIGEIFRLDISQPIDHIHIHFECLGSQVENNLFLRKWTTKPMLRHLKQQF